MINVAIEEEVTICHKKLSSKGDRKCIGSACMAWRYVETLNPKTLLFVNVAGYCGLAGKPECLK